MPKQIAWFKLTEPAAFLLPIPAFDNWENTLTKNLRTALLEHGNLPFFTPVFVEKTELLTMDTSAEHNPAIMVVGRREYVLENVRKLLEREGFETYGLLEDQEDLVKRLLQPDFSLLVMGGGVDPHVQQIINEALGESRPDVKVVHHSGGPATLLPEVRKVLTPH